MNAALRAVAAKAGSRKLLLAVAAAATAAANRQWAALAGVVITYIAAEAHVDATRAKAIEMGSRAVIAAATRTADSGRNPVLRPEAAGGAGAVNTASVPVSGPVTIHPAAPATVTVSADAPFTVTADRP